MRLRVLSMGALLCAWAAFAQTDRGTITGTVADPAGAVVANAAIEAKNLETGAIFPVISTTTGNYTIPQLPVGSYEVSVTVPGFKRFVRSGIKVDAAAVIRIDAALEVGQATESVTIQADASLLKTETADLVHNITADSLQSLPILGIGGANAGSSGVRNPYNMSVLIPGVNYFSNFTMVINGAPGNSAGYRLEGQDMTNHYVNYALQEEQPSADAIQEVAIQTSNYAPEFGTAGGGLFNITLKSGTNQYHGTGYEYFVNEDLNAGYPFSSDGHGDKYQPRNRRNDFGFTLGGPVFVPKIYNGRDKTFFFFSYEQYRESQALPFGLTVPSDAYRAGDFSAISPNGGANFNPALSGASAAALPSTDALGRPIYANTIYDPSTERTAPNGVLVRDPFPGNIIPASRFNPIALKIQSLFPAAQSNGLINNASGYNLGLRTTDIPSVKIDHSVGSKGHLSFSWYHTFTDSQYSSPNGNADGLPAEITLARGTFIHHKIFRLNYDHTLTPTLLLHLGAGYQQLNFFDDAPYLNFNAQEQLGLAGFETNRNFPNITGLCAPPPPGQTGCGGGLGGMQNIGTTGQIQSHSFQEKPSYNASLTWVHGNHSYKIGGEVYTQGTISNPYAGVILAASSATSSGATGLPQAGLNLGGQSIGFGYANFLLGDFISIQQNTGADYRVGKAQWATFVQDSWKVTRKLTLDYGLRWDYGTYAREQYGRASDFGPNVANPNAGGRPGGTIYEATCNCQFANNYPYAIGPRIGVAYNFSPKWVLRAGWGFLYGFTQDVAGTAALSSTTIPGGTNEYLNISQPGVIPQPQWPVFNAGLYPAAGTIGSAPTYIDPNAGRPPRQNQYSIGVQHELSTNLVVEASYVGNRDVWTGGAGGAAGAGPLGLWEQVSPATFAKYGLDPYHNPADNLLLSQPINSPAVIARVGNVTPYAGFPATGTLISALRPYPQFAAGGVNGGVPTVSYSPTGKTWYDSLQVKANKRFSHGLQATGTFTYSKALTATREDIFNPASSSKTYQTTDQPFLFNANVVYTVPQFFHDSRLLSTIVRDWEVGAFLQYGSGFLLTPPAITTVNNLSQGANYQTRVPGVPLYLKNINGNINPTVDQILNPAAWTNPVNGTFGTNQLWGDFRGPRHPSENFNFGRNFRIKERMNLQIRAEFVNVFNRLELGNPLTSTAPANQLTRNSSGLLTNGFGVINAVYTARSTPTTPGNGNFNTTLAALPRTGTIIARFTF